MNKLPFKKLIIFSFLLIILGVNYKVYAKESIDINKKTSIDIHHSYEGKPLENLEYEVHKVATMSSLGKFTLLDDYNECSIDFDGIEDESEWYRIADTLASYIEVGNIFPTREGRTDNLGKLEFTNLEVGLYLIIVNDLEHEGEILRTRPFLISLPTLEYPFDEWVYNAKIEPKTDAIEDVTTSYMVEKVWKDDKGWDIRPDSIKVTLYKNGVKYETVDLNENNKWNYSWDNLSTRFKWTVIEDEVPEDYLVSYERYGTTFTITNKFFDEEATSGIVTTGNKIPKWPFVLLVVGVGMMMVGSVKRKKSNS